MGRASPVVFEPEPVGVELRMHGEDSFGDLFGVADEEGSAWLHLAVVEMSRDLSRALHAVDALGHPIAEARPGTFSVVGDESQGAETDRAAIGRRPGLFGRLTVEFDEWL